MATKRDYLETIVVADVEVHDGKDVVVEAVLNAGHFVEQSGCVMVVNERQAAYSLRFGLAVEFVSDESVAHQVANRFGSIQAALCLRQLVKTIEKIFFDANAKTYQICHS